MRGGEEEREEEERGGYPVRPGPVEHHGRHRIIISDRPLFHTKSALSHSRFFPHAFSLLSNINTAKSLLLPHIDAAATLFRVDAIYS